jgi:sugar lactone lactonase YvrE
MEASSSKPAQRRDAQRTPRVDCLVNARAALAQGLVWDTAAHRLFWVNSPSGQIFSVSLSSGVIQTWTLPCPVGAIALCSDGRILALLLDGIYLFDPRTHDLHFLATIETEWALDGQSFGLVGPDRAFWINVPGHEAAGSLHRVAMDGAVVRVTATKAVAPSGLGWTADGRTMYGADMNGGWISRWAFDPRTARLSHGARIVTRGKHLAAPGGGAVDAEGGWGCLLEL